MAICEHCGGEMTDKVSCREEPIVIDGTAYQPVRWGEERRGRRMPLPEYCTDCATPVGGVHHPGCCAERCPVCLGQAFGCWHFAEPEEPDEMEDAFVDDLEYAAGLENDGECRVGRSSPRRCEVHRFRQARRG